MYSVLHVHFLKWERFINLAILPLKSHGYHLHKGAFRDSHCLRYGWDTPSLLESCVCGSSFSIDHALNCPCGGLPSLRHNELRNITASFMRKVCHDVTMEPVLQPLSGEDLQLRSAITDDRARSDIKVDGFWSCGQQSSYFDVKVFSPTAPSYCNKTLSSSYRCLEEGKQRAYEDRITHVEHGTFSPLFTTSGGMGPSARIMYKRLASPLSAKRNESYSKTLLLIRCKIGFALIRSALQCLRSSHPTYHHRHPHDNNINLALTKGQVSY